MDLLIPPFLAIIEIIAAKFPVIFQLHISVRLLNWHVNELDN